jgi:tetratricopeptide (TPR) repeat protein
LVNLLIQLGQFNRAQQVCEVLLDQTLDEREEANNYHMLGLVKDSQGECAEAITFYEKSIKIKQKILSPTDPNLATSYAGIGSVYDNMGDYWKALSFHEKALEIFQKTLPPYHPSLATSYNNIGSVYSNMNEYLKALSFYKKDFKILQKTLPPYHPSLATSYNNIGSVYSNMNEYLKALSFYKKDFKILQKLFLKIILIWLLLTATSVLCISTWVTTRKHFHLINVLWILDNIHYLQITLIFNY